MYGNTFPSIYYLNFFPNVFNIQIILMTVIN